MARYTIISTDCHAGPLHSRGGFLDYVEPRHRARMEQDMAQDRDMKKFQEELSPRICAVNRMEAQLRSTEAERGVADPARHLAELASDGVVADVIFQLGC